MRRPVALVMMLILAACGSGPGGSIEPRTPAGSTSPASAGDPDDVQGAWLLTAATVDGSQLGPVPDHRVTLIIEGTELDGVSACNHYFVRTSMGEDGLRLEGLGATDMACRRDAMALESMYLAALGRVRQLEREGNELVGTGEGVELRYTALESPPTADLVDTTWLLDGLIAGEAVAAPMGEPAWIEVRSDGTFSGSTGCRSFEGEWMERGDQIITPTWGMDSRVCPPQLEDQDRHVVVVIEDAFIPSVDGDRLTLMDIDGTGLAYRVQR